MGDLDSVLATQLAGFSPGSAEGAGIGVTPARLAKAASERMRPRWDQAVSATAAVTGLPRASTDPHAVEAVVVRLRQALGNAAVVHTVVKRGYRPATPDTT